MKENNIPNTTSPYFILDLDNNREYQIMFLEILKRTLNNLIKIKKEIPSADSGIIEKYESCLTYVQKGFLSFFQRNKPLCQEIEKIFSVSQTL